MINGAATPNFFDGEVDFAVVDLEGQRHCHFAKVRVRALDPLLEPLRIEISHVPQHDGMDELTNNLALTLRCRMQTSHKVAISSRNDAQSRKGERRLSFNLQP